MTAERVREFLGVQPFRPFLVHLADGRSVIVKHPETLVLSPSGRTAMVSRPGDTTSIIDLMLVTELERLPANGSGSRWGV
jgi:hypothetical protein